MNPTLATLTAVSVTVIAAILVVVLLVCIPVLLQVRRTAREAEKLIDSVRMQVAPISRDIGFISRDIRGIIQTSHRQMDRVEGGIETLCDMATRAKEVENEILLRIEQPLLELAAVLGGIQQGIEAVKRIFSSLGGRR